MKFSLNQQDLQKSLNYCQGVIEKRSTLPILSNVLLNVSNGKLTITATDLDLIFIHQIPNVEIYDCYGEFIDTISKVTFTTLNQDEDICNQAVLHEEVLDVIKFKQNLMGVLGFRY